MLHCYWTTTLLAVGHQLDFLSPYLSHPRLCLHQQLLLLGLGLPCILSSSLTTNYSPPSSHHHLWPVKFKFNYYGLVIADERFIFKIQIYQPICSRIFTMFWIIKSFTFHLDQWNYGSVWSEEKRFFQKIIFQFSVVGAVKNGQLFSNIIFIPMEKNDFHFEKAEGNFLPSIF